MLLHSKKFGTDFLATHRIEDNKLYITIGKETYRTSRIMRQVSVGSVIMYYTANSIYTFVTDDGWTPIRVLTATFDFPRARITNIRFRNGEIMLHDGHDFTCIGKIKTVNYNDKGVFTIVCSRGTVSFAFAM